jgi:uncharacterized protein YigA (DUF484 family)
MNDRTHIAPQAAYAVRREARSKLEAAAQTLERGRHVLSDAEAELAAARSAEDAVTAAHASKLQQFDIVRVRSIPA